MDRREKAGNDVREALLEAVDIHEKVKRKAQPHAKAPSIAEIAGMLLDQREPRDEEPCDEEMKRRRRLAMQAREEARQQQRRRNLGISRVEYDEQEARREQDMAAMRRRLAEQARGGQMRKHHATEDDRQRDADAQMAAERLEAQREALRPMLDEKEREMSSRAEAQRDKVRMAWDLAKRADAEAQAEGAAAHAELDAEKVQMDLWDRDEEATRADRRELTGNG